MEPSGDNNNHDDALPGGEESNRENSTPSPATNTPMGTSGETADGNGAHAEEKPNDSYIDIPAVDWNGMVVPETDVARTDGSTVESTINDEEGFIEPNNQQVILSNTPKTILADEKSFRSEDSTKPDPPSILDEINGMEEENENDLLKETTVRKEEAQTLVNVNSKPLDDSVLTDDEKKQEASVPPTPLQKPVESTYSNETMNSTEEAAAQALATLSRNIAEASLVDETSVVERPLVTEDTLQEQEVARVATEDPENQSQSNGVSPLKTAESMNQTALSNDSSPIRVASDYSSPTLFPKEPSDSGSLPALPTVDEHQRDTTATVPSSSNNNGVMLPPTAFLPPVVHHATMRDQPQFYHQQHQPGGLIGFIPSGGGPPPMIMSKPGRTKIDFRLEEEMVQSARKHFRKSSIFGTIRKSSTRMLRLGRHDMDASGESQMITSWVDRGTISVSWYDGTTSLELQQHVRNSVIRKLKSEKKDVELEDIRIIDESTDPPEEIVLSPYIPSGSRFLLRFSIATDEVKTPDGTMTPGSTYSGRPPVSPSAAPSPHPEKHSILNNLNGTQLALLNSLNKEGEKPLPALPTIDAMAMTTERADNSAANTRRSKTEQEDEEDDDMVLHSEDPIESRLREITQLLIADRKHSQSQGSDHSGEKRQVIFVVTNYLMLFLLILIFSIEIQMRAPNWMKSMEDHLQSIQNCSENQEALFECVMRGDLAGLIASVLLFMSRSVATRRIFLFGFDTPKKLWTVVYESLVTSICWGISYLFIRRGMNPDTRRRFVQKYWKDAVYGSLAGFNAAFLKQILKNLVPQDVVEDAFKDRKLKILGWWFA